MSQSFIIGAIFAVGGFSLLCLQVSAKDLYDAFLAVARDIQDSASHDTHFFPDHVNEN